MPRCARFVVALWPLLSAGTGHCVQYAYEPVGLGWSAQEVDRAAADRFSAMTGRAHQTEPSACGVPCQRSADVFARLVVQARAQTRRSATLPWSLTVVALPDIEAAARPEGEVVISEWFVAQRLQADEALAFVLAHEMAHSILEHERQALTYARLLLARETTRSVEDMYAELNVNWSLLWAMEPVMQQGEYEADEIGLLLASAAGYAPERQLAFMVQQCETEDSSASMVQTHPPACLRLRALQALLPLAKRQQSAIDQ